MDEDLRFLPLFRSAAARRTDPETSHEAAKNLRKDPKLGKIEHAIYYLLRQFPEGMTMDMICGLTGIKWNTASPRSASLKRKGLIRDSGRREPGDSGRKQIVWEAL